MSSSNRRVRPADRMSSVSTLVRFARMGEAHRHWYTDGVPVVHREAARLGCTARELADVLAITSPRVQVWRNVQLTRAYLVNREYLRTLDGPALAQAIKCVPGVAASLIHWESTGEIRGPKTSAFAEAVLGDPDALVLDVWMSRALGVDQARLFTVANHAKVQKRMQRAAADLGWTVAETQAAVWAGIISVWRDARGRRIYASAPTLDRLLVA